MDSTPTKRVETILQVRVTHSKPLPFDVHQKLAEVAAHRVYDWLYARGVECGVKAEISLVITKSSD